MPKRKGYDSKLTCSHVTLSCPSLPDAVQLGALMEKIKDLQSECGHVNYVIITDGQGIPVSVATVTNTIVHTFYIIEALPLISELLIQNPALEIYGHLFLISMHPAMSLDALPDWSRLHMKHIIVNMTQETFDSLFGSESNLQRWCSVVKKNGAVLYYFVANSQDVDPHLLRRAGIDYFVMNGQDELAELSPEYCSRMSGVVVHFTSNISRQQEAWFHRVTSNLKRHARAEERAKRYKEEIEEKKELTSEDPVQYKKIPWGFLDGGDSPAKLSEAFTAIYKEMNLKPPEASAPLRLCFYSAGAARAEVYIIEKLMIEGYRIGMVYLCDTEYGKKSFEANEQIIADVMKQLGIRYKLLKSNDALIAETLQEIEESGKDAILFKYDAIIGIHNQTISALGTGIKGLTPVNDKMLAVIGNLTEKIKVLNDTSKIAKMIAPTMIDTFFPPLIAVGSNGPTDIIIFRKPSTTTNELYRRWYNFLPPPYKHIRDEYYENTISPLYRKFLEMQNNFIRANPLFMMSGKFGRVKDENGFEDGGSLGPDSDDDRDENEGAIGGD
jgi:hypothetical protein